MLVIKLGEFDDDMEDDGDTLVRAMSHSAAKCGDSAKLYVGGVVLADMCDRRWRRHRSGEATDDDDVVSCSDSCTAPSATRSVSSSSSDLASLGVVVVVDCGCGNTLWPIRTRADGTLGFLEESCCLDIASAARMCRLDLIELF